MFKLIRGFEVNYLYSVSLNDIIASLYLLFFHSWSFGVLLWEMATLGMQLTITLLNIFSVTSLLLFEFVCLSVCLSVSLPVCLPACLLVYP